MFVEPSCLSAMQEDVPALLRGRRRARAETVAGSACCSRRSSNSELAAGRAALQFEPARRRLPCIRIATSERWAWRRRRRPCCGASRVRRSTDLDAGCCGMAGSFGYSARALRRVARDWRTPAVAGRTRLPPGGVIVAGGTSCRHQVADFAGVEAVHPARLLRCLLEDPMNIAWHLARRVAARHPRQLLSQAERRRPVAGSGVDRRRLPWRHALRRRHRRRSQCRSSSRWPASRCSSAWPGERHAVAAGALALCRCAAATSASSRSCSSSWLRSLSSSGPGNIATAALLAPMAHGRRRAAPAYRRS